MSFELWDRWPEGTSFDRVVIRSTGDYCWKWREFEEWVRRMGADSQLVNPPATALWSADKNYLKELAIKGVPTIPTEFVSFPTVDRVLTAGADLGGKRLILKPVRSAGGRQVALIDGLDTKSAMSALDRTGTQLTVMVQQFHEEIFDGEISLIFIAGEFSHAVMKMPADGSFLTQAHFGGDAEPIKPKDEVLNVALHAMEQVEYPWAFARVDVLPIQGIGPAVVEIELLEPDLFLRFSQEATNRLAQAILGAE
jgi:glutathione synthase/RimK-type ligase-like ATP-grasp enzyme